MIQRIGGKLVIAFFANPAAVEVAARVLAKEARDAGRPAAVGALMLDTQGKIDAAKLGDPASPEGPGVGAVLGVIALVIAGGVLPSRGHFFDARSDLSTDDVARFGAELDAGAAAIAVLETGPQAERVLVRLAGLGGRTEVHSLSDRALQQAASAPGIAQL